MPKWIPTWSKSSLEAPEISMLRSRIEFWSFWDDFGGIWLWMKVWSARRLPKMRYLASQVLQRAWRLQPCIRGRWGGTSAGWIPEVRGTRGSLPEGTSQPDDPGGVGGYLWNYLLIWCQKCIFSILTFLIKSKNLYQEGVRKSCFLVQKPAFSA